MSSTIQLTLEYSILFTLQGRKGIIDDFVTIPFHLIMLSCILLAYNCAVLLQVCEKPGLRSAFAQADHRPRFSFSVIRINLRKEKVQGIRRTDGLRFTALLFTF